MLDDAGKPIERFIDEGPVFLLREEQRNHRLTLVTRAARQHEARRRKRVEREFPQHEFHLAGIDISRLQRRIDFVVERSTMRARH